jgi:hypothetical protein
MDYERFTKKLSLPDGLVVPDRLVYDDVVATALGRNDLDEDVRGINASVALIAETRGGGWPTGPVTAEEDFVDLVWHELEWRDGYSYSYGVYRDDGAYLGCAYLYPLGRRTPLSPALLDHDVDVSWWVTPEAHAGGYYEKLYAALRHWLATELSFWRPHYSNRQIPGG